MKMTLEEVLSRLVTVGPAHIRAIAKPGPCCVLATAIGIEVLSRFGHFADPFAVSVRIGNEEWIKWSEDGYPGGKDEQIKRGAYMMAVFDDSLDGAQWLPSKTLTPERQRWDGHLVARVGRMVVDLDTGSFTRHDHGLVMPSAMAIPLEDGDIISGALRMPGSMRRVYMRYEPLSSAVATSYENAPDWIGRYRYHDTVDAIVEDMRDIKIGERHAH